MRHALLLLSLSALTLNGCTTIPNTEVCTVAGQIEAGAICAETLTGKTRDMTMQEFITFLLPTPERAGAMCQSVDDFAKVKTALEEACRLLGKRCKKEIQETISHMELMQLLKTPN